MKNFLHPILCLFVLALTFMSCETDSNIFTNEEVETQQNLETLTDQQVFADLQKIGLVVLKSDDVPIEYSSFQDEKPTAEVTAFSIEGSNDLALVRKIDDSNYESYILSGSNKVLIAEITVRGESVIVSKKGEASSYVISENGSMKANPDLGPRREEEDFGDCFSRNWMNFCDDFSSCAAQVVSPHAVGAAIAISCV